MTISRAAPLLLATLITGCAATKFSIVGEDEYRLSKDSSACAAGSPQAVLTELRSEAAKFCAGRKHVPAETGQETEYGIPFLRCASASLTFRCSPP